MLPLNPSSTLHAPSRGLTLVGCEDAPSYLPNLDPGSLSTPTPSSTSPHPTRILGDLLATAPPTPALVPPQPLCKSLAGASLHLFAQ